MKLELVNSLSEENKALLAFDKWNYLFRETEKRKLEEEIETLNDVLEELDEGKSFQTNSEKNPYKTQNEEIDYIKTDKNSYSEINIFGFKIINPSSMFLYTLGFGFLFMLFAIIYLIFKSFNKKQKTESASHQAPTTYHKKHKK